MHEKTKFHFALGFLFAFVIMLSCVLWVLIKPDPREIFGTTEGNQML